jgi:hypothetical protein
LAGLFGAIPAEQLALRITGQGCYVRVPSVELLPALTDNLLALRPDWGRQLSVMFIVNAQEHAESEVLAGRVRALHHQLMRVRKGGIALPLMLLSYLQASRGEGPWFSWRAGQASPDVREAGQCVNLGDWQVQTADSATGASRLQTSVQLDSAAAWPAPSRWSRQCRTKWPVTCGSNGCGKRSRWLIRGKPHPAHPQSCRFLMPC